MDLPHKRATWEKLQMKLQEYYDEHSDLDVPKELVLDDGYRLGDVVSAMRDFGVHVEDGNNRAWLEERGWQSLDVKWEELKGHLQAFYDKNKHLNVKKRYKTESGYPLGMRVESMRSSTGSKFAHLKGHPDRCWWVKQRGFVMHARDAEKNAQKWADLEDTCKK